MIPGLNVNSATQSDDQYMTQKRLVKEKKEKMWLDLVAEL